MRILALFLASTVLCSASGADFENPEFWIQSGQRAIKAHQEDLAKGYFDQAVKLSKSAPEPIVRIGILWLKAGRLETSLPYLLPNLSWLNTAQLARLGKLLEDKHHLSAAILVLRYQASQSKTFSAEAAHAAALAFHSGQFALCSEILVPYAGELDSASASRFLLANFYTGGKLGSDLVRKVALRSGQEVQSLAALILSLQGSFKEARSYVIGNFPLPVRSFIKARELDAGNRTDDAVDYFKLGLDSKWPEFRIVVITEFFKHYSLTGNRYKVDQLWEEIKGQEESDTLAALKELLAYQLGLRGYEKQSRYLYRSLYRLDPGRPAALKALWEELITDDSLGLDLQIQSLLKKDSLDCDANLLAMRFARVHGENRAVVHHGRNTVLYCPDVVEPYLDLANALLAVSRPDEARIYYAKFIRRGGDRNRIPTYMR